MLSGSRDAWQGTTERTSSKSTLLVMRQPVFHSTLIPLARVIQDLTKIPALPLHIDISNTHLDWRHEARQGYSTAGTDTALPAVPSQSFRS